MIGWKPSRFPHTKKCSFASEQTQNIGIKGKGTRKQKEANFQTNTIDQNKFRKTITETQYSIKPKSMNLLCNHEYMVVHKLSK